MKNTMVRYFRSHEQTSMNITLVFTIFFRFFFQINQYKFRLTQDQITSFATCKYLLQSTQLHKRMSVKKTTLE